MGMDAKPGLIARTIGYLGKNGRHILIEALVNFILPFVIYSYAETRLGDVRALLGSSVPPILWSFVEFARHRRLDALSVLVVSGIALSLLAMLGGGGVRFLQLREKLVTAVIGLVFVLSIREYLIVNPILGYGTMGGLSLWSFLYGQRAKRRGEARRHAQAASAGEVGVATAEGR